MPEITVALFTSVLRVKLVDNVVNETPRLTESDDISIHVAINLERNLCVRGEGVLLVRRRRYCRHNNLWQQHLAWVLNVFQREQNKYLMV